MVTDKITKSEKNMSLDELQSGNDELAVVFQGLLAKLENAKQVMSYENSQITIDPYSTDGRQFVALPGNGVAVAKHPVVIMNAPYKGNRVQ